jgi:phage terminase large subunit-like protein
MRISLTKNQIKRIFAEKDLRVALAKKSFYHFLKIYLRHRFTLAPATFHKDIIDSLDSIDDVNRYIAMMGFRGSAKSTFLEAFAIWSAINEKHNFIIWIGNTIDDSKLSLANIRDEIEQNGLLRSDFGIIIKQDKNKDFRDKWSETQLTVGDCTILAKSRGQKIRGLKYKEARIDLIICDDLEDVKDADTAEKRKATRLWFFTEVMPATKQGVMAENVKVVMLGNLVHRDCLLCHLSKGKIVRVLRFPLIDENGNITWKGLYPNMEAVEKEKEKVMLAGEGLGHIIWAREYLLKEVDAEDMIIKREDIQFYPVEWLQRKAQSAGVGVDFAISKKQTADYTAMVKAIDVNNDEGERRLLILPNPLNKRINFAETISTSVDIDDEMPAGTVWYPEKVAYQEAAIEIMEKNGLKVVRMPSVTDKRSRAIAACFYIKNGRVLLSEEGSAELIDQLLGFGIEDHDDLVDALGNVIFGMVKKKSGAIFG